MLSLCKCYNHFALATHPWLVWISALHRIFWPSFFQVDRRDRCREKQQLGCPGHDPDFDPGIRFSVRDVRPEVERSLRPDQPVGQFGGWLFRSAFLFEFEVRFATYTQWVYVAKFVKWVLPTSQISTLSNNMHAHLEHKVHKKMIMEVQLNS